MQSVEKIEEFLSSLYLKQGSTNNLVRWVSITVRHPVTTASAIGHVMRVPVVNVKMTDAERADALWLYSPRRPWRLRGFVSSYIELPSPLEEYWRGGSKQELRRRTSQARVAGYKAMAVEHSEIIGVIARVYAADVDDRVSEIDETLRKMEIRKVGDALDQAICVAVYDERDTPVAFCLGTQAGNVVTTLLSGTSERGTVRWLCFSGFVEEVSARDGKYIIQPPPWVIGEGNSIFARHLGFSPGRIRRR